MSTARKIENPLVKIVSVCYNMSVNDKEKIQNVV